MKIKKIQNIMSEIKYGFLDKNNKNIIETDIEKWDNEFNEFYYLQSPQELLKTKCGVCWDQVELERYLFKQEKINIKTYFICTYDNDNLPSHTFLMYKEKDKYIWFENSWQEYRGIHKYENKKQLLLDIKNKFIKSHNTSKDAPTIIYEYKKPKYHITCQEMYDYCETQKIIKLNKPLYFYHVINKNASLITGIYSLKYMYDHKMYDLFDKNIEKYKQRIVDDWNIKQYKGRTPDSLSREEIIDVLNNYRGEIGTSYIYFFKYFPYKKLGKKIEEMLKYKDIYRININDEKTQKYIKNIFYGYDLSNSDNKKLNKKYYENITKKKYFEKYDDNLSMNFSTLNHIGIAFNNDYCPIELLKKIDKI